MSVGVCEHHLVRLLSSDRCLNPPKLFAGLWTLWNLRDINPNWSRLFWVRRVFLNQTYASIRIIIIKLIITDDDSFTYRLLDVVLNPVYSCLYSEGKSCDRDDGDSSGQETDDESPHTYARQLQYPGSAVTRFPVPEEKVSWEVTDITFMHSSCEWTSTTFCLIFLYFVRHTFCSFRQTSRRTFLQFTVSKKASKIWFDLFFQ